MEWLMKKKTYFIFIVISILLSIISTSCIPSSQTLVRFFDLNLEKAIRQALNKPAGDIYTSDLEKLTELRALGLGISDLRGIEYCIRLELLNLMGNNIMDISILKGLNKLKKLYLGLNHISDLSPVAELKQLQELELEYNNIYDINALSALSELTMLYIGHNDIEDISVLNAIYKDGGLQSGAIIDIQFNQMDLSQDSRNLVFIKDLINYGIIIYYEIGNHL